MPTAEKIFSWVLKGGLLLTPFLVFVVTRSLYFPFITGKNFAFRILIEALAAVWVYAALRFPRFRPSSSPLTWALIAFVAIMGIATIFALSPYRSFWSNFERMEGYIGLLHLFTYFLLLISVFKEEGDWKIFFYTSLASSVAISLYALFQLAGKLDIHQGGTRVDATLGNATYLAAYLLFHLFFIIWFFLRHKNLWLRIGLAAAFLLELVVLYYTATRGSMLGFLGGLVVLAIIFAAQGQGVVRKVSIAGLAVLVIVPLLFFAVRKSDFVLKSEVLSRFAAISFTETTTVGRLTIWNMAIKGWAERPILGWGQDAFIYVFSKYYDPSLWKQEPWFDRAHNVFLDWLIAGGILGLVGYLAIFAAAFWLLVKAYQRPTLDLATFGVLISLLLAHFFQILFVFDNLTSWLLFFAVLGYIHVLTLPHRPAGSGAPRALVARSVPAGIPLALGVVASLAFAALFYFANLKPILAAGDILGALATTQSSPPAGKVDALIAKFKAAIAENSFGTMETREQISQVASLVARDQSIANQDKMKYLQFAEQELEAQHRAFPTDVRASAFLATVYSIAGQSADALRVIDEALRISPNRQQFYFVQAEAYINLNQGDLAIQALKKAYLLAPDYREAATNLVTVMILAGKDAHAEAFLQEHAGSRFVADSHYARAYTQRGEYAKAARVWSLIVQGSPTSAEYHADYGVVLARLGEQDRAVQEIQEAMRLEPKFQQQGQQVIDQIRSGQFK